VPFPPCSQRSFLGMLLSGQDLTTGTKLSEDEVVAQVGYPGTLTHTCLCWHTSCRLAQATLHPPSLMISWYRAHSSDARCLH
jgi:hypothetical protein